MKHLKKFNESLEDEKEFILENFIFISDRFGDPQISSSKYGDSLKWNISWDLKLDLSVLQEADQLISKLKDLVSDIDDVIAASDRLEKYNINMSITHVLRIELVPKETGSAEFNFIKEYDSRTLYVRINEIERFFNSKGIRIENWDNESSYNEYNQTNDLAIVLNKRDTEAMTQFYRLIMAELNPIKDDKEYQVRHEGQRKIVIYPDEEKAWIEVTYK